MDRLNQIFRAAGTVPAFAVRRVGCARCRGNEREGFKKRAQAPAGADIVVIGGGFRRGAVASVHEQEQSGFLLRTESARLQAIEIVLRIGGHPDQFFS